MIPKTLVDMFAKSIPEFNGCSPKEKAGIAALAWMGSMSDRYHKVHQGYFSCHYTEIHDLFGKSFKAINERIRFVQVQENWWCNFKDIEGEEGHTKGYRLSAPFQTVLDSFLSRGKQPCEWVDMHLRRWETPAAAIQSKDVHGVTTTNWNMIRKSDLLSMVPVNTTMLEKLDEHLKTLYEKKAEQMPQQESVNASPTLSYIKNMRDVVLKLALLGEFDPLKLGRVHHTYLEYGGGRVYAKNGINLQNAPRLVRKTALAGYYDYDMENCHFAILLQLAGQYKMECPGISHYIQNKKKVRQDVADYLGISVAVSKEIFLALMYGAQLTDNPDNAIPKLIGIEGSLALSVHPWVTKIVKEVKQISTVVVKNGRYTRQGSLINLLGKRKTLAAETTNSKLFAHILQGIEAAALRACMTIAKDSVVLLQHDGFTSTQRLDKQVLEQAILRDTGFILTLEETLLQYDPAALEDHLKSLE